MNAQQGAETQSQGETGAQMLMAAAADIWFDRIICLSLIMFDNDASGCFDCIISGLVSYDHRTSTRHATFSGTNAFICAASHEVLHKNCSWDIRCILSHVARVSLVWYRSRKWSISICMAANSHLSTHSPYSYGSTCNVICWSMGRHFRGMKCWFFCWQHIE